MDSATHKCNFVGLCFLLVAFSISPAQSSAAEFGVSRSDFPDGFLFGAATSAYQVEGACLEDGKSLSNWDSFCRINGTIDDGGNGDVATDHYHHYMEDIENMKFLGLTAYRFSISWSRVLPRGSFGGVNQPGIEFYNKIIDNLLLKGIQPVVTIHHGDYPQEFEDRFSGWLSPLMQDEFAYFAETCFNHFGDRVRYWISINEPGLNSEMGFKTGKYPPGRCSPPFAQCDRGNSDVEPLTTVHNKLLAHAKASKLYHDKFKNKVDGVLGITIHASMYLPFTNTTDDIEAAKRVSAFEVGWVIDPLVFGDYPPEMRRFHGNELPTFLPEEKILLRDSIDFIGLNHYTTLYARDCIHSSCPDKSSRAISGFVHTTGERNGVAIGDRAGIPSFFVTPAGMEGILNYVKDRYGNKPTIVTENSYSPPGLEDNSYRQDVRRVQFHRSYLGYLARAIRNGADVKTSADQTSQMGFSSVQQLLLIRSVLFSWNLSL